VRQLLKTHNSPAKEVHHHAFRTGRKLLRIKNQMHNMDLYGLLLFAGSALWHTNSKDLKGLVLRLESEQTFEVLTRQNKGWFSRAKKAYDGMLGRCLNLRLY
jgi:hypothetical protein